MSVKEKNVELIELFYDLIYVYAISRMTVLVEEPEGGILTWEMFGTYIVASMVIIQAWLYMTNYVNRYCTWRWYEYALVVLNMCAAIMMSNTITTAWIDAVYAFELSMIVMIGSVAALYLIQIYVQRQDTAVAKHTLDILFIILAIYIVALIMTLFGLKEEALMVNAFNIVLGMMLPFIKKGEYDLKIVSFPHLVERLELLTIITFGEGIVGITVFFEVSGMSLVPILSFLILIFMFGAYVCQVHYLCDHHQVTNPNKMTWSHYLIVISINLVTVAFIYFHSEEADHLFTASLMITSLLAFYLALFSTSWYYSPEFCRTWKDALVMVVFIVIGAAVIFGFMDSPYGFLIGSAIATGGNFFYIWHKYSSNRCVNVIHSV
jgi:low temperature requirement protein LtrA